MKSMKGALYNKSPIREAIFDVRLNFEKQPDQKAFEEFFSLVKKDYPKREIINSQTLMFEVKIGEEPVINSSQGANGLKLSSLDGTKILQIRPDGFTFSKLPPYLGWDAFIDEVKTLFDLYLTKTEAKSTERIALRYINAIEINESNFRLEDYFLTNPRIADDLPQGLIQFFSRVVIKDDKTENTFAIVNQTVEENKDLFKNSTTVILDIDVFKPNAKIAPSSEDFWKYVQELKVLRTRIFEGSLTEKTKELFN
jgi:uncharacterized protein (TIGR04255 family)